MEQNMGNYDAIIVGAGVAGLTAARVLEDFELRALILEGENRVGGRVKTSQREGFLLDHGFQVLLTAYPLAQKYLDYEALNLQTFASGALCFGDKGKLKISDVQRDKSAALRMLFSPSATFMDKIRLANLRAELVRTSPEEIFQAPEQSTLAYLRARGFSERVIKYFFRPFFSGIFLEAELQTSARFFRFVFKMFAEGEAALPAEGMEAIPRQLAAGLQRSELRLQCRVESIHKGRVVLQNGEELAAPQVIVATAPDTLLPQLPRSQRWHSTEQFYFTADQAPFRGPYVGLFSDEDSPLSNIVVLDQVAESYAPAGHLVQVSLKSPIRGSEKEKEEQVKKALTPYFGPGVLQWQLLQRYAIERALPVVEQNSYRTDLEECRLAPGIYLAGDQQLNPSLNGAMYSGEIAAKALIRDFQG